jgi:hypothetical protein
MGLMQRSFLDIAEQSQEKIELALVIDGTDSMKAEILGVQASAKSMLEDLRRYRDSQVSVAIVVYRDVGSPSGPSSILLDRFSADDETISQAILRCVPESGAPFFHEMPDIGVQVALDQLPWSTESDVTRWVILFGDAPPYAETYTDTAIPQAKRMYSSDLLVALAARKGIQIHCILCNSAADLETVYQAAVPETRKFMTDLATGTGGVMLDLSYPEIREAMIKAGAKPKPGLVRIEPITESELVAVRTPEGDSPANPSSREVRIAILPHMPLQQINFDPRNPAVQVSTALRHKLESMARVRVSSPYDVERQMRRLRAEGLEDSQRIRALAARLGVDYVVWGDSKAGGPPISSVVYSADSGETVAKVQGAENGVQLASLILKSPSANQQFESLRKALADSPLAQLQQIDQSLAKSPATEREILAALEALQQALGYRVGDPAAMDLLRIAERSCQSALKAEPTNGLAYWLSANTAYNLAQAQLASGEVEAAEKSMRDMVRDLSRANVDRYYRDIDSPSLQKEIQADYEFLVKKDLQKAIQMYELLCNDTTVCSSVRRRAHWALAGIYCGDWGVDQAIVSPSKARSHAIAIMANWEESPEADLLRQWLRWNPDTNQSEFPYLPKSNETLADFAKITET